MAFAALDLPFTVEGVLLGYVFFVNVGPLSRKDLPLGRCFYRRRLPSLEQRKSSLQSVKRPIRGRYVDILQLSRKCPKYGGLSVSELKRIKELEVENARLKKMYAELSLVHDALKDAVAKTL